MDSSDGFEALWRFVEAAEPLDTSTLQPFEGADVKWQKIIDAKDEVQSLCCAPSPHPPSPHPPSPSSPHPPLPHPRPTLTPTSPHSHPHPHPPLPHPTHPLPSQAELRAKAAMIWVAVMFKLTLLLVAMFWRAPTC